MGCIVCQYSKWSVQDTVAYTCIQHYSTVLGEMNNVLHIGTNGHIHFTYKSYPYLIPLEYGLVWETL